MKEKLGINNVAVLLVEGIDDEHTMYGLFKKYNIPDVFSVENCKGIDKLLKGINTRLKIENIEKLGIVIDADQDIAARWSSLKTIFAKSNFTLPNELPSDGLTLEQNDVKIGVWIMPDNNVNGMLEDFTKFLIPDNDNLLPIVEMTLNNIEADNLNKYNKYLHKSKALIHTWLAWQEDPGTPQGLAITKKYLTTENKELSDRFIGWIKRLFVE
jgi:hypothetical protein